MSIVIQKKRFNNKKAPSEYAQKVSQFEKHDPLHEQYFQTFNDFEVEFKKNMSQTTLRGLKNALDTFYKTIKTDEFLLNDLSRQGENIFNKNENTFLVNRASDIVNMVSDYIVDRRSLIIGTRRSFDLLDKATESQLVTLLSLKVLKLFSIINAHFAILLSNKAKFCSKMFELMLQDNKLYFKHILAIQEALIACNPEVMRPAMYPFMQEVLMNMPKKYFARFSRIMALFVLETTEKTDFRELSSDYTDNKMVSVHSFLLSVPDLIETYTIILEHLTEITETLVSTTTQNLHKTVRYLMESNLIKDSGLNLSFLKPLFEQSQISEALAAEIFSPKFIVKFIVKKSNLTEILFILSNLLQSKRKLEVQSRLRQINFLDRAIQPLFDLLFHPELDSVGMDDPFYDDECITSPLMTTRIQLLRIIISFCDRDSQNIAHKDLLLSPEEKTILYSRIIHNALIAHHSSYTESEVPSKDPTRLPKLIGQMTVQPKDPSTPLFTEEMLKTNAFESVKSKGLMHKIIKLFERFDPNSNYRFWLASCVESFLRGFYAPYQIFVAHTGLFYKLLSQVLGKQITRATNIQISFDLIGEIFKFNRYNILFLENLCRSLGCMEPLAEQALKNIVDSNVFLRALFLSFERFEHTDKKDKAPVTFNENSNLYQRFSKEMMNCFLLTIEAIDPDQVNQDNICCVNTMLVMAILADQCGNLEKYIERITVKEGNKSRKVLKDFGEVLRIWHKYYMSKTKDSFSLQFTSSIPFYYFQEMKARLEQLVEERLEQLCIEERISSANLKLQ